MPRTPGRHVEILWSCRSIAAFIRDIAALAVRAVTIGAELPGAIRQVSFESGQAIRRGDPVRYLSFADLLA